MTLNELIDRDGIETISELTNVSVENLRRLSEDDFDKLNRVRALGFIKILERDYEELELDDLTFKIKAHFEENQLEVGNEVVVISSDSRANNGFGFFSWLLMAVLLYALWYFYNDGPLDNVSKHSNEVSLNDTEALKSDVSDEDAKKVIVNSGIKSKKDVQDKHKISNQPSAKKILNPEVDLNNTQVLPTSHVVKLEEVEIKVDTPKVTPPPILEEANETVVEEEEDKAKIIYNLTINPTRGMLWYGFINIDTKERREFMNKVSTPFELNAGRWILVTGHGFVDIVSDLKTLEIADRNKHYFYIDSTDIREISRREFRELNGRRGW